MSAIKGSLDLVDHGFKIAEHLVVANSNDAQTHRGEEAIALVIELATIEVDSAVDLNDEPSLRAIKVSDEPVDDKLSSKADSESSLP